MNGAMFQMIGHGISSAGMFFLVGVIYDRAHHRNLDNFRGLYEPMPLYGGISAVIFFAALGLPGLCGFVGEFMVVLATWNFNKVYADPGRPDRGHHRGVHPLDGAARLLRHQPGLQGLQGHEPARDPVHHAALILAVALGIWPQLVLSWVQPHMTGLIDSFLVMR